ncbi:hypothetical protein BDV23DRAFT_175573 [Aspergillus alliaceus]|uniref:Zn(2)-C6 fungal-type domain-containing protein n=1 Tax=Petromyces alliaceus TaxID=209559 RepID=A0A5N7BWV8_PETAA|nr:hypothetical protein BDV23DRAFT_175573 [Aspergillus alliaceus]
MQTGTISKLRQTRGKRSKTGCRTCRARHVKCDEAPGACKNCTSTGRSCEGYDMHRLPDTKPFKYLPDVASHMHRAMNADERRCFSYFRYHTISDFVAFFDWQLWQRLVLQMVHAEPAVYHAVNMLAAIHEDSVDNDMRLTGLSLGRPRHRFALEQSARSLALLNKRHCSHDPELQQVTLMCCLLFTLSEFLLGQYSRAFLHLQSGIRILNETHGQRSVVCSSRNRDLIEAFRRLDIMGSHYGIGPLMTSNKELAGQELWQGDLPMFNNLEEALQVLRRLMAIEVPWVTKCWALTDAEIEARSDQLDQKQQEILSRFAEFALNLETFCQYSYDTLSFKEQRGADLLRLQHLSQSLTVKICLTHGPVPDALTPEFESLLAAHEAFITKLPERPTIFLDIGIISGLYCVSNRCPDYRVRFRAIKALQSWPHFQGMMNSNLVSAIAIVRMQSDLHTNSQNAHLRLETQQELARFLFATLTSTQQAVEWPSLRYGKALQGSQYG